MGGANCEKKRGVPCNRRGYAPEHDYEESGRSSFGGKYQIPQGERVLDIGHVDIFREMDRSRYILPRMPVPYNDGSFPQEPNEAFAVLFLALGSLTLPESIERVYVVPSSCMLRIELATGH